MSGSTGHKDKRNYMINLLYVRQEFDECLKLIEQVLEDTDGLCECALFTKGLIKRQRGQIQESLQLFQQASALNPHNIANLKQVARSLHLLGKHKTALQVYEEAAQVGAPDWETLHNKGLCAMHLKQYGKAIECFNMAIELQSHDSSYLQLGKLYTLLEDYPAALGVYGSALEQSPENSEIMTTLGLMYQKMSQSDTAYEYLTASLQHDPKNAAAILAVGAISQDYKQDIDNALIKYRVAAVVDPNSAQLWNNIGMCFFGKQRFIAAVACLKKAQYLAPFEWAVVYNLGIVHLHTGQAASAFHYLSAAVNLKPNFAHCYMYLGAALAQMGDIDNACAAYNKAIKIAALPGDKALHLNYGIMLYKAGRLEAAAVQLRAYTSLSDDVDIPANLKSAADIGLQEAASKLADALGM